MLQIVQAAILYWEYTNKAYIYEKTHGFIASNLYYMNSCGNVPMIKFKTHYQVIRILCWLSIFWRNIPTSLFSAA